MSLNYGTLKTKILADAHRPELTSEAPGFVRQAESVIYSTLRAAEMITRVDLTDSDRVTADEGFYTLPSDYLEERQFFLLGTTDRALESVSLAELRTISGSASVRYFSIISDGEVEFRGVPGTSDTIELIYFARPAAFSSDSDTNDILTRYEDIYVSAGLAALYTFTQDLELAQAHSDIARNSIEALNEQAGRMLGGARTQGFYNFQSWESR